MEPVLYGSVGATTQRRVFSIAAQWTNYEVVEGEARTELAYEKDGPFSSGTLAAAVDLGTVTAIEYPATDGSNIGLTVLEVYAPGAPDGYYRFWVRHWNGQEYSKATEVVVRLYTSVPTNEATVTGVSTLTTLPELVINILPVGEYIYATVHHIGSTLYLYRVHRSTGAYEKINISNVPQISNWWFTDLDYNPTTGFLYLLYRNLGGGVSTGARVYAVVPDETTSWEAIELYNSSSLRGGGLALSEDGSSFYTCSSGTSLLERDALTGNDVGSHTYDSDSSYSNTVVRQGSKVFATTSSRIRVAEEGTWSFTTAFNFGGTTYLRIGTDPYWLYCFYGQKLYRRPIDAHSDDPWEWIAFDGTAGSQDNLQDPLAAKAAKHPTYRFSGIHRVGNALYMADWANGIRVLHLEPSGIPGSDPGEDPTGEPPTPPAEVGDPIDGLGSEYLIEISEDSQYTATIYTFDPQGGSGHVFRVLDEHDGRWVSTPQPGSPPVQRKVRTRFGTVYLRQAATGHVGLPEVPEYATAVAELIYEPDANKFGEWDWTTDPETGDLVWNNFLQGNGDRVIVHVLDSLDRISHASAWYFSVKPVYDPPSTPRPLNSSQTLSTDEDTPRAATYTVDYPGDGTAEGENFLRYDINPDPQAELGDPNWDDSAITLYDDDDGVTVAGVLTVSNGGVSKSNPNVVLTFTPAANWTGSTSAGLRAYDGGDGIDPGVSTTRFLSIVVRPVNDPPTAPTTNEPTSLNEDETWQGTFTWTDREFDPLDPSTGNTIEVSVDKVNWGTSVYHSTGAIIDVLDEETDDLTADVRVVPAANYVGSVTFYVRAKDPEEAVSAPTTITLTFTGVPDRPSAPQPSRMPTTDRGIPVTGRFWTVDPDSTSWTWELSESGTGGWNNSSLSLTGVGTLTILGQGELESDIRFVPSASFTGEYSFWIRVTDNSGLTSPAVRVTGYVQPIGAAVDFQKVDRTGNDSTVLVPLGPLPTRELTITESLEGNWTAEFYVPKAALQRRAADLGMEPEDLVEKWSIEPVITYDAEPRFCGPITDHNYDAADEEVRVLAEGLLAYFDARTVEEEGGLEFNGYEQSAIIWALVNHTQSKPRGDLLITNATTNTSQNRVFEAPYGAVIGDLIEDIRGMAGGPEVWITPNRELVTATRRGTDRSDQIIFTERNTEDMFVEGRERTLATVVTVKGDNAGTPVYGTASASSTVLRRHGRVVEHIEAPYLSTQQQCEDVAEAVLAERLKPVKVLRFTHRVDARSPIKVWDYSVGDLVRIEANTGLEMVNDKFRVVSRRIRFSDENHQQFEVEITAERSTDGGLNLPRVGMIPRDYETLYRLARKVY